MSSDEAKAEKKCDASKLQVGDVLSRVSYMKVTGVSGSGIQVKNEAGMEWSIGKSIVEGECYAADHFTAEETVNRTRLAEILENEVRDTVFTVQFAKQPTSQRAQLILTASDFADEKNDKARKRKIKEVADKCLEGEKRILRGHLFGKDTFMGRSTVIDLDIDGKADAHGGNQRQVDHRSLEYLIFKNKKYVRKQ